MAARRGRRSGRRRTRWWILGTIVLAAIVCATLVASGALWPNRIFASAYPVRGVDVSAYQGEIDWPVLASQSIDFAFIKATEGSSDRDPRFERNWTDARATGLTVGAYHFFSFDSAGATQAQNIIRTVPAVTGTLPVAIDLELYSRYVGHAPSRERVRGILDPLLAALRKHYGMPAIIYATQDTYDRYLRGGYPDDPLWIRSAALPPSLPGGRDWRFWQYSSREHLDGYDGDERYIDMNVFAGSRRALGALRQRHAP